MIFKIDNFYIPNPMGQVLKSVNSFWMVELQSYRICKLAYSFYGKCTKSILYILEVFRAGVPNSERNALIRNAWNWDKYKYETSWNAPEMLQKKKSLATIWKCHQLVNYYRASSWKMQIETQVAKFFLKNKLSY